MSIEKLSEDSVLAYGDLAKKLNELIDILNQQENDKAATKV